MVQPPPLEDTLPSYAEQSTSREFHFCTSRGYDPDKNGSGRELDRENSGDTIAAQPPNLPSVHMPNVMADSTPIDGRKWRLDYYIKFALLVNAAICAALHLKWANRTFRSISTEAPASVFIAYTFVNAYIILEYRLWYRTSKRTKQLFGLIGGFVFSVAGVMELYRLVVRSDFIDEGRSELGTVAAEDNSFEMPTTKTTGEILTSVAFLSLTEAALYFVDVFIVSI